MVSKRAVAEKYFAKCNCLIINEHRKAAWGHWALETEHNREGGFQGRRNGLQHQLGGRRIWMIPKPRYGRGEKIAALPSES